MGLNIKCKIRKMLEKHMGENLGDLELGEGLLDMTPKTRSM